VKHITLTKIDVFYSFILYEKTIGKGKSDNRALS